MALEELMKHGPFKPEGLRGLNLTENIDEDIEEKYKPKKPEMPEKVGTRFNEDPGHQRTGWVLDEKVTETILKAVTDAKEIISSKKVQFKKFTTIDELLSIKDILKAGVMIGYPGYYGLPEWEPVLLLLEEKVELVEKEEPNYEVDKYI